MVVVKDHQQREPSMGNITTIGLDLAKSVFQVHTVDEAGSVMMRKRLRRSQVLAFFARGSKSHFFRATRCGGKGTPSFRARVFTEMVVRLNIAAARTGDAPAATKTLSRSLSASDQDLLVCRMHSERR
jgi:hypothetical protein